MRRAGLDVGAACDDAGLDTTSIIGIGTVQVGGRMRYSACAA